LSLPTAIREFRGLLEFTAGLIEELLGFLRMAAQLIGVRSLRFVDFLKRLQDMVLGFGEVRMPSRVNVRLRPLSKAHADQGQANDRYRDEAQSVVFHGSLSLSLWKKKPDAIQVRLEQSPEANSRNDNQNFMNTQ
jgi:hypothetical protein